MKHSTKLIIWILIFAFSFGVIACGSDPEPNRVTEDPVAVVTAAPVTVSAVAASTEHFVEVVVTPPPTPELPTLPHADARAYADARADADPVFVLLPDGQYEL